MDVTGPDHIKWTKPVSERQTRGFFHLCFLYFCVNRPIKSCMYMTWKYKKSRLEEQRSRTRGQSKGAKAVLGLHVTLVWECPPTQHRLRPRLMQNKGVSLVPWPAVQHTSNCTREPQSLNSICFAGDNDSIPKSSHVRFKVLCGKISYIFFNFSKEVNSNSIS